MKARLVKLIKTQLVKLVKAQLVKLAKAQLMKLVNSEEQIRISGKGNTFFLPVRDQSNIT